MLLITTRMQVNVVDACFLLTSNYHGYSVSSSLLRILHSRDLLKPVTCKLPNLPPSGPVELIKLQPNFFMKPSGLQQLAFPMATVGNSEAQANL